MLNIQTSIFYNLQEFIEGSPLYRKYYLLFQCLDLSEIPDRNKGVGCTGHSRRAILRAFIVKHLEEIKTVPRLMEYLENHPVIAELCGFDMRKNLPDESQFYRFLKTIKNSLLQEIYYRINEKLIDEGIISLDTFIMDSKPVMAATKDNNFKNPNRNTTDKHKTPKRNPAATLSYYSYQNINGTKKNRIFYWGYRTHVIVTKQGIPLIELTLPNNQTDATVAKKLIRKLKRVYGFNKNSLFIADAGYDEKDLYDFIVEQLNCQAFIPINPRNTQDDKQFSLNGCPICEAGMEMKSHGIITEPKRSRIKYRCPLKHNKKLSEQYPHGCPLNHSKFVAGKQYGCTKYVDITDDARARVPRDSLVYQETYKLRTEVERYFARLGDREAEQTTHYNMKSVKNQMTIAHLSLSLIAYAAAVLMKQPDKIRCYRTFAHEYIPLKTAA
jgi:IS5 family transposase